MPIVNIVLVFLLYSLSKLQKYVGLVLTYYAAVCLALCSPDPLVQISFRFSVPLFSR